MTQRGSPSSLAIVVAVVTAGACGGKTAAKIIEKHRATTEPQLAKLAAIVPIVTKQAPVTEVAWKLPAGVKLDFNSMSNGQPGPNAAYNAIILWEPMLARPCDSMYPEWPHAPGSIGDVFSVSIDHAGDHFAMPACALQTGEGPDHSQLSYLDGLEEGFDAVERARYVLVIRMPTMQKPNLPMGELGSGKELEHFVAGRVAGDALLYEIATGAFLGGFPFDVSNKAEVEVRAGDPHGGLALELMGNFDKLVREQLKPVSEPLRP